MHRTIIIDFTDQNRLIVMKSQVGWMQGGIQPTFFSLKREKGRDEITAYMQMDAWLHKKDEQIRSAEIHVCMNSVDTDIYFSIIHRNTYLPKKEFFYVHYDKVI